MSAAIVHTACLTPNKTYMDAIKLLVEQHRKLEAQ